MASRIQLCNSAIDDRRATGARGGTCHTSVRSPLHRAPLAACVPAYRSSAMQGSRLRRGVRPTSAPAGGSLQPAQFWPVPPVSSQSSVHGERCPHSRCATGHLPAQLRPRPVCCSQQESKDVPPPPPPPPPLPPLPRRPFVSPVSAREHSDRQLLTVDTLSAHCSACT